MGTNGLVHPGDIWVLDATSAATDVRRRRWTRLHPCKIQHESFQPWLNAAYPAYCNYIPVRHVAPKRKSITLACQSRLSGQGAAVSAISVTQRQETMEEKMSGTQSRFDKQSIALQTRRRCWKKRKSPSQRRQCGNRAMAREPRHRSIR